MEYMTNSSELLELEFNISDIMDNASTTESSLPKTSTVKPEYVVMFYTNSIACGIFTVFGLLGNFLAFLVLHQDKPMTTTSIILRGLAVSDSLFLISSALYKPMLGIYFYTKSLKWYVFDVYIYIIPYLKPVMFTFQHTSIWLVVIVAVDRYFAVCKPMKMLSFTHANMRARLIVIGTFLFCALFNLPRYFEWKTVEVTYTSNGTNKTRDIPQKTALSSNEDYWIAYNLVSLFIIMYVIPMITVAVINSKLICTLRAASRTRLALTGQARDESNVTFVLVVVVLVFIACQTPDLILQVIYFAKHLLKMEELDIGVFDKVTELLLAVNASINFIVYCVCGTKFRKTMMEMFHCKKRSPRRLQMKGKAGFIPLTSKDSTSSQTGKSSVSQTTSLNSSITSPRAYSPGYSPRSTDCSHYDFSKSNSLHESGAAVEK